MLRTVLASTLGFTAFVKAVETPSISSFDIIENALEGASLLSLAVTAPKRDRKLPPDPCQRISRWTFFLPAISRYFRG